MATANTRNVAEGRTFNSCGGARVDRAEEQGLSQFAVSPYTQINARPKTSEGAASNGCPT